MNDIPIAIWVAGIAACASVFGIYLNFFLGKSLQRIDLEIKNYMAQTQSELARIAARQASLKELELKNVAAGKVADALLRRYEALRNDVRDILALLTLYEYERGPFSDEVKIQAFSLCHSISLFVSPKGAFNEEVNLQLGHIREFFTHGSSYWRAYSNIHGAFRWNCWLLMDAKFERIRKTIATGSIVERDHYNLSQKSRTAPNEHRPRRSHG